MSAPANKQLQGSPINDWFRRWHKDLDNPYYACDLDLFLYDKPRGGKARIVAALDMKSPGDDVGFSHVAVYNRLMKIMPVFIVWLESDPSIGDFYITWRDKERMVRLADIRDTDTEEPRFRVARYLGGDWGPPVFDLRNPGETLHGIQEWKDWEDRLRGWFRTWSDECKNGEHLWRAIEGERYWRKNAIGNLYIRSVGLRCDRCGLTRWSDPHEELCPLPGCLVNRQEARA